MTARGGISLLDLISGLPPGAAGLLPDRLRGLLELFAVDHHVQTQAGVAWTHSGIVRSISDQLELGWDTVDLRLPAVNAPLPFTLRCLRAPSGEAVAPGSLEGPGPSWVLDLHLDDVALRLNGPFGSLQAATRVPAQVDQPAALVADPQLTEVWLRGGFTLRIAATGPLDLDVALVADRADPFVADPAALHEATGGTGLGLRLEPPHVLLHRSGLGLTLDRLQLDLDGKASPPSVLARGQDAAWTGISVDEATLYLPRGLPLFGDVNLGVHHLLLGLGETPGLQGELLVQLGQGPQDPDGLQFWQDVAGVPTALDDPSPELVPGGGVREVELLLFSGLRTRVRVTQDSSEPAIFVLPGGRTLLTDDTGWFWVAPEAGEVLQLRQRLVDEQGRTVLTPPVRFRFRRGLVGPETAPTIALDGAGPAALARCVHLSGPPAQLAGLRLRAVRPPAISAGDWPGLAQQLQWGLDTGGPVTTGPTWTVPAGLPLGEVDLVLSTPARLFRRVRLELRAGGPVLIGAADAVHDAQGQRVAGREVVGCLAKLPFHQLGVELPLPTWDLLAELEPPDGVDVATGVIAQVAVDVEGARPLPPPVPPAAPLLRHQRVLFQFDAVRLRGRRAVPGTAGQPLGPPEPWPVTDAAPDRDPATGAAAVRLGASAPAHAAALRQWVAGLPEETRFLVIGRTCDIGGRAYNEALGKRRAQQAARLLTDAALGPGSVDTARVWWRGEDESTASWRQGTAAVGGAALDGSWSGTDAVDRDHWAVTERYPSRERWVRGGRKIQDLAARWEHRSADIYALGPDPAVEAPPPAPAAPERRVVWVAGEDGRPLLDTPKRDVDLPWTVTARARWDSPRVVQPADWIPTLVELSTRFELTDNPVPAFGGPVRPARDGGTSVYHATLRVGADPRVGALLVGFSLDAPGQPDGLFRFDLDGPAGGALGTALALGPALLSGVDPAEPDGDFVRLEALVAAGALGALIVQRAEIIVQRVGIELVLPSGGFTRDTEAFLACDYQVALVVPPNNLLGLQTQRPVQVRYADVGVEYRHSGEATDRLRLRYSDAAFVVEDPGQWTLGGQLGRLLGVGAVRLGGAPVWLELELEPTLDLGVVEISRAEVRLTAQPAGGGTPALSVALRGLALTVELPGVVRGGGQLQLGGDGGDGLGADLALELVPVGVDVSAWIRTEEREGPRGAPVRLTALEAAVGWASGLPLAASGLGLFGLAGRFVSNGRRDLSTDGPDPVRALRDWHDRDPAARYRPEHGQNALGIGVVVGTLPDGGFAFHGLGMLVVDLPDPGVLLSIEATVLARRPRPAVEQRSSAAGSLRGLVLLGPEQVLVSLDGRFFLERLVDVTVPFEAVFPGPRGAGGARIFLGSDGSGGRPDRPVSVTVLPGVLDIGADAFFLIAEDGLRDVGARYRVGGGPRLDLPGFAVAFGARFGLDWGSRRLGLSASASLIAGIGTRPFLVAGTISVAGSLRLIITSVGASGRITVEVDDDGAYLDAEFCGRVRLFFTTLSACLRLRWGDRPVVSAERPVPPLVQEVALLDGWGRTVARVEDGAVPVVWPDTIVELTLAHGPVVEREARGFSLSAGAPMPVFGGADAHRVLYRLDRVAFVDDRGEPIPGGEHLARWAVRVGLQPSARGAETAVLRLLDWRPEPASRSLGAEAVAAGDPFGTRWRWLCEEVEARPGCVFGHEAEGMEGEQVRLAREPGDDPLDSAPALRARGAVLPHGLSQLRGPLQDLGFQLRTDHLGHHGDPAPPDGLSDTGWVLPQLRQAGALVASTDWVAQAEDPLRDVVLDLALAGQVPDQPPERAVCVRFEDERQGSTRPSPYTKNGFELVDLSGQLRFESAFAPLGAELVVSGKGLAATLPGPALAVELELDVRVVATGEVTVRIELLDEAGTAVHRWELGSGAAVSEVLAHRAPAGRSIHRVIVQAQRAEVHLTRLCATLPRPWDTAGLAERMAGELAESGWGCGVWGLGEDGLWVAIPGENHAPWSTARGRFGVHRRHRWAPERGRLRAILIQRLPLLEVHLLRLCGVTAAADAAAGLRARQHAAEEAALRAAQEAAPGRPGSGPGALRHVLAADREHRLELRWRALRWTAPTPDSQPPAVDTVDWSTVPQQTTVVRFRTAPRGALSVEERLRPEVQHRFEPAALVRHLRGVDPGEAHVPHFLDDELLVHFSVTHLDALLARYGLALQLRVLRTDGPPGSATPEGGVVPVPTVVRAAPNPLAVLRPAERAETLALRAAPCVDGEDLPHGTTLAVAAELEADASYDLVLEAIPRDDMAPVDAEKRPGEPISVHHFRTSRWRGPRALLAALGLAVDTVEVDTPVEHLLPALPAGWVAVAERQAVGDDAVLGEALALLGLEPLPPPRDPATHVVWARVEERWAVVAVVLDCDEPVHRPPRLEGEGTVPRLAVRGARLSQGPALTAADERALWAGGDAASLAVVAQDRSGTRLLLAPREPVALGGGLAEDAGTHLLAVALEQSGPGGAGTERLVGQRVLGTLPTLLRVELS